MFLVLFGFNLLRSQRFAGAAKTVGRAFFGAASKFIKVRK